MDIRLAKYFYISKFSELLQNTISNYHNPKDVYAN